LGSEAIIFSSKMTHGLIKQLIFLFNLASFKRNTHVIFATSIINHL